MNRQEVLRLIAAVTGQQNVLTIPRLFIDLCDGSLASALLLSQLVYWSDRAPADGWVAKSRREWQEELGLSSKEARTAQAALIEKGFIATQVRQHQGIPTVHYRVDHVALVDAITGRVLGSKTSSGEQSDVALEMQLVPSPATPRQVRRREPATPSPVHELLDAIRKTHGEIVNYGQEAAAAKRLLGAGFLVDEILTTYSDWRGLRARKGGDAYGYSLQSYASSAAAMIDRLRKGTLGVASGGPTLNDFADQVDSQLRRSGSG